MSRQLILRVATLGVGLLLIVLNGLHLSLGLLRMRKALTEAAIAPRFAEPLATAWVYLGVSSIVLGLLLVLLSGDVVAGNPVAWKASVTVGAGLVALGLGSYVATSKHPGLLLISVLGFAILIPLFLFRPHSAAP